MNQSPDPTPQTAPAAPQRRFTVSRPEDIVAFVPLALKFIPERSVVMLTFSDSGASFHARVDLPTDADDLDDLVETLLRPARRHHVTSVVFVLYDDDSAVTDAVAWCLRDAFLDDGIDVIELLRVWGDHWFAVLPGHPPAHYRGVRFDLTAHPFTVQGVVDGHVVRRSREDVRASLDPVPAAVAAVEGVLAGAAPVPAGTLADLLQEHLAGQRSLSDHDLAAVALAVARPPGRDEAWAWLTRQQAPGCVELWSDAVRRLPDAVVASPAAVLAFAAWLAGDGALAWCAVERSQTVEPGNTLAALVADLLHSAASPETWGAIRAGVVDTADPAA